LCDFDTAQLRMKKPGVDPTKLFFLRFFFFGIKLGHFTLNNFFLYVTKTQAYLQKRKNSLLAKKKSLVGSTPGFCSLQ